MGNLKVADCEYSDFSILYNDLGSAIEDELLQYLKSLESLLGKAIKSGYIHENLSLYKNQADKLKNQIIYLTAALSEGCVKFIEDIDRCDKYLY